MTQATGFRRLVAPLAAFAMIAGVNAASAQEISESHLAAARQAIAAIDATEQFDGILPRAAQALKAELIQKDPNLEEIITKTVDEKALALAARRADLETEAARAYAKSFSEEDLKAISAFYESQAGKKLIAEGPIVTREVLRAANIWQNGIARDLAQSVGEALSKEEGAQPQPQQ
ncbi:hypothetical protein GCM10011491_09290 [Brucella endophytica]|uniref:DUF2059 domain-containing protein n=1 Tax=Brucella endophytica TaxID=1963359 RepID=A0A916S529_9HYPH|nr:DUF2059 domain-containing protein [Brucella endophytica]GGA83974.1 hypothetical protein GCM10011491_09290 [Brucella endophytica]